MKRQLLTFLAVLSATVLLAQSQPGTVSGTSGWVKTGKPPVINWQSPQLARSEQKTPTVRLTACVQSVDPLTYHFYQNGKELPNKRTGFKHVDCGHELTEEITLESGVNELHLTATNPAGTTTSESRYVTYKPEPIISSLPINQPKRLALVVANASYPKFGLKNPVNDGRLVKEQLEKVGFTVTFKENLPIKELKNAIDVFAGALTAQPQNVGLFFYAGHGLMVNGDNYIQPVDATPGSESDVPYDCYSLRRLVDRMKEANPTGANLVFWDACRNNPYRSWSRGLGDPTHAPISPTVGNFIVYATEPGKEASDGMGENGLFTSELVKHMVEPGIDLYALMDRIEQGIRQRGFEQTPYSEGRLRGKFYFVNPQ